MAFLSREWSALLRGTLEELGFMPRRARLELLAELDELQALAAQLHRIEVQLNRARIEYLGHAMPLSHLQGQWHQQAEEVRQSLEQTALRRRMPSSWLGQRVLDALDAWERDSAAVLRRPMQPEDPRDLQRRLEALADNLFIYVSVQQDRWSDRRPAA